MRSSRAVIILLAFVLQANAKDEANALGAVDKYHTAALGAEDTSLDKFVDKLVDKILNQAVKLLPLYQVDMDNTRLSKTCLQKKLPPLLLPPSNGETVPQVICGWLGGLPSPNKEPAGRTFHNQVLKKLGLKSTEVEDEILKEADSEAPEEPADSFNLDDPEPWRMRMNGEQDEQEPKDGAPKGKKKKKPQEDLYKLIGLSKKRYLATEQEIKKAYQQMALIAHPDKAGADKNAEEKAAIEEHFKHVQAAYETLMDPVKRREFDSTDSAFDDSLPTTCNKTDFFDTFGAAFLRQSRWSDIQPVPQCGDDNTPWPQVEAFYNFWMSSFKSWREFPHEDEEEIDDRMSYKEKEYIKEQNKKLRRKAKEGETKRMQAFVVAAYKWDPRVKRQKEEREKAKLAEKEKMRAAMAANNPTEKPKIQVAKSDYELKRDAEKEKELKKKAIKKQIGRLTASKNMLRKKVGPQAGNIKDDDIQFLLDALGLEKITALSDRLDNPRVNAEARANELVETLAKARAEANAAQ